MSCFPLPLHFLVQCDEGSTGEKILWQRVSAPFFWHRPREQGLVFAFMRFNTGLLLISAGTGFVFGKYLNTWLSKLFRRLSAMCPSLTAARALGCTIDSHNSHFSCASRFSPLKCFKNISKLSSTVANAPWRGFYSQVIGKGKACKGSPQQL